jgi:hypothetical protein
MPGLGDTCDRHGQTRLESPFAGAGAFDNGLAVHVAGTSAQGNAGAAHCTRDEGRLGDDATRFRHITQLAEEGRDRASQTAPEGS